MQKRYRLYIDESGDHTYGKKEFRELQSDDKQNNHTEHHYPEMEKDTKRYLGLVGCIIESEKYKSVFHPEFEKLKQKYFPYSPDEPIVFHRKELVGKKGPFWRLRDKSQEEAFNNSLLSFLTEMEYSVIMVVIDKKRHIEKYQELAYHPYHFCLRALLERYCGYLHLHNAIGDVLAENRAGSEDKQLKLAYKTIFDVGTQYRSADFFQSVLTTKEIKLKPKSANIAGLQLADLIAHPLKQEILIENGKIQDSQIRIFGKKICEVIKDKYNKHYKNGKIESYGKVFIK